MDFFYVFVLYLSNFYAACIEWFLDFKFVAYLIPKFPRYIKESQII